MKVYFNSIGQFIEQDTTMDLFIKGNNGNVVECYFNGLDISDVNLRFRMVVKWSDETTTNELPMNKSLKNDYVYLTLPILKVDGEAQFIIRIYRNTYIEHTAIFKRGILAGIDASDDTVTTEEYEVLLQNIDDIRNKKQDVLESGQNIKTINGMSITGEGNLDVVTTGDRIWIRYAEDVLGTNMSAVPLPTHEYMGTYTGVTASANASDYVWAKYSSELTTVSNGVITTEKLADGAVTSEKTSFIDVIKSVNLLNPEKLTDGYLLHADGTLTQAQGYSVSDFIEVKQGDEIYITFYSGFNYLYQNVLFDNNKNVLGTDILGPNYMECVNEATAETDGYRKFIVPDVENVKYYRASMLTYYVSITMMITKGYYPTTYIPYYEPEIKFNYEVELGEKQLEQVRNLGLNIADNSITTEKLVDNSVTLEKTSFINNTIIQEASANLFNKERAIDGAILTYKDTIVALAGHSYSDFMPVNEGEVVYITSTPGLTIGYQCTFYDENKQVIKNIVGGYETAWPVKEQTDTYLSFDVPTGGKYYRTSLMNRSLDILMVTIGSYPDTYIDYQEAIIKKAFTEDILLNEKQLEQINNQLPTKSLLNSKSIACCGDSIMESRLGETSYNGGAWPKLIGDKNNMIVNNIAKSGSTICNYYDDSNVLVDTMTIYKQLESLDTTYDYIIFDGGVNDFSLDKSIGSMLPVSNYSINSGSYNKDTILGSLECLCMTLNTTYSNSKYGWVFNHKIYYDTAEKEDIGTWLEFKNKMKDVFKKWGVPYLDLEEIVPPLNYISSLKTLYTCNGDGWHPNEDGYRKFYCDKIEAWLESL